MRYFPKFIALVALALPVTTMVQASPASAMCMPPAEGAPITECRDNYGPPPVEVWQPCPETENVPVGTLCPIFGTPAVPVGFEEERGDDGFYAEPASSSTEAAVELSFDEPASNAIDEAAVEVESTNPKVLAYTGASTTLYVTVATIMLLAGVVLVTVTRKRVV